MILSASYLSAMFMSGSNTNLTLSPVNPAVAAFMTITYNNS